MPRISTSVFTGVRTAVSRRFHHDDNAPPDHPRRADSLAADTQPRLVSWRLGVASALLLPLAAAYSLLCLAYNAPASPAQIRLAGPVDAVMNTYFTQDWMLFAPTPATDNSFMYVQVQLRHPGSTTTVTTVSQEIEAAIDVLPRGDRVLPTKLPGVVLAFQEDMQGYAQQLAVIDKNDPKKDQPAAESALAGRYHSEFVKLQRFLSVRAATLYPGDQILAVRASFARQPIVPFSQRYETPAPPEPVSVFFQTTWFPYVPGVTD